MMAWPNSASSFVVTLLWHSAVQLHALLAAQAGQAILPQDLYPCCSYAWNAHLPDPKMVGVLPIQFPD